MQNVFIIHIVQDISRASSTQMSQESDPGLEQNTLSIPHCKHISCPFFLDLDFFMALFSYVSDSKKQTDLAEDRSVPKCTYSKENISRLPPYGINKNITAI